MTKTQLCRRAVLAALVAGTMAAAHEAHAGGGRKITVNGMNLQGLDPNGSSVQGLSPHEAGRDAPAPARAADPSRLRLRAVRPATPERAAGPEGGVRIAAGTTDKPEPTPTPKK